MNSNTSIKLDAFRFCAALAVVCAHSSQIGYIGPGSGALIALGRIGVVAFFVLSGFVIAHVCDTRHDSGRDYFVARLARLHSVFLPALALTWVADLCGRALDPSLYATFPAPLSLQTLLKAPLFAAFLHESPLGSLRWLSNGPLWSIAYEFWYYAIYAAYRYGAPSRRALWIGCAAILAGPKILIMLPFWLLGVWLYRSRHTIEAFASGRATAIAIAGLAAVAWLGAFPSWQLLDPVRKAGMRLVGANYSGFFLWDMIIVVPLLMIMVGVVHPAAFALGRRSSRAIRLLAGATFSTYCFHVPLLLLARASGAYAPASLPAALAITVAVLISCFLLSWLGERRKAAWVRLWDKILPSPIVGRPHA